MENFLFWWDRFSDKARQDVLRAIRVRYRLTSPNLVADVLSELKIFCRPTKNRLVCDGLYMIIEIIDHVCCEF